VFVGGVDLYRSVDGGSTWGIVSKNTPHKPSSSNAIHPDNHDFGFDPANPSIVYALTDGGLFRSDRMGEPGSWQARNTGLATLQVTSIGGTPADPDWIAVGAQDNGTHLRTDRSNVWRPLVNFGGDGAVTLIDPSDKDIVYGERQNGFLQRTLDGGRVGRCILQRCSGDPMNEGRMRNSGITGRGIWHTPLVMDPQEPQRIYTSTLAMMWVTNNAADPRGVKWDPIGPPVARIQHIAVDRIDNDLIYAYSGPSSLFIRSEDGGATWDTLSFPGKSISDLQPDPDERGVLYATRAGPCRCSWETPRGTTHRVMISGDAGDSWTALDQETPTNLPLKAHTVVILPTSTHGDKRILVGTDLGVLASSTRENGSDLAGGPSPGRRSWRDVRGNLPYVIVRDLEYNRTDNSVRAGTYGRGVWRVSAEDVFRPLETEGDVEDDV
jgi:hypothetical protein